MSINFTKEQFEQLLKLAYLGNWMINAPRTDDTDDTFDAIEEHLFSHAKEFGLENLADSEEPIYPSRELEEQVGEYIDDYNENIFWDELVQHLVMQKVLATFTEEELQRMEDDEKFALFTQLEEKVIAELEKNGLPDIDVSID